MRFVLLIIFSLILFLGCGSQQIKKEQTCPLLSPSAKVPAEHYVTSDIREVENKVKELSQSQGANNVIVIFDIDNTLLEMKGDLGSDQWFTWQENMIFDKIDDSLQKDLVANSFDDLIDAQGLLYSLGTMKPPDSKCASVVGRIQKVIPTVFVLTSRGHDFRYAALRELYWAGFNFKKTAPTMKVKPPVLWKPFEPKSVKEVYGFSDQEIKTFKLNKPPRDVTYLEGLFFTAGQNKGAMTRILMHKTDLCPKALVFVDDKEKHTTRIQKAFENSSIKIVTFHYTRTKKRVEAFDRSNKSRVIGQWKKLQTALDSGNLKTLRKLFVR